MQYIKECLQLLYWIYFKPYTLKQHVREICPEITNPYFDIYRRSVEAKANPHLKRYDDQCWWLSALVPISMVFLTEGMSRLIGEAAALHFNWWLSSIFPLGWLLGHVLVRAVRNKMGEKSTLLVLIVALALYASSKFLTIPFMATGMEFVAFGMVADITVERAVLSMAVGIVTALSFNQSIGVVGGLVELVSLNVMLGVPRGYIPGLLRIPFWLPEVLWMFPLRFWPRPAADKLRFLPPQFDQVIHLPLPFLPSLIAEAYQENRAAARQTIDYLVTSTNQQKAAGKAVVTIAVKEFRRCSSASDIAALSRRLTWISVDLIEQTVPAKLAVQLAVCLELSRDVDSALEASTACLKEEWLKQVCQQIAQQRSRLASSSASGTAAISRTLKQWQGILETDCRLLREIPGPPAAGADRTH